MSVPAGVFTGDRYEHDPRWSAVDSYTVSHLHSPAKNANTDSLNEALAYSNEQGLPDIATYPTFSKMLALQCRAANVEHFLEVGTLGGYTPIWIATTNPAIRITSIEIDQHHADVARRNIERAGVGDRVNVIVGPALEVLPKLREQIDNGELPKLGLTYIDADKENNWNYFDMAASMSRSNATIYVDNIVRRGWLVSEEHQDDKGVQGARLLIENVGKDERVDGLVLQTVCEKNYDGFLFAVLK